VVGLDRSDAGRAAVEQAAEIAARKHMPLRLVHAYGPSHHGLRHATWTKEGVPELLSASARRLVDDTVDVLRLVYPDLAVTSRLEPGSAVGLLVEESRGAAFLVVGSRGSGGFADLAVGSTTQHVASQALCPVLAVPCPPDGEPERRGVVVGVDGSPVSEHAIELAFEMASELEQPLDAVHAWTDPAQLGPGVMLPLVYDRDLVEDEERLVLAESLAGWADKYPDVVVTSTVTRDHPVPALVRASAGARVLVVGSRGRGPVSSALLGSVSHGVLHHATVPVAVVRRGT
jgi:nucleotide-binding universal stress UspA family protein